MLSGNVFSESAGEETDPLQGAVVELYCSFSPGELGDLLASTTSDAAGYYELPAVILCEYYRLLETDLPGYLSMNSTTQGGMRVSSHQIDYRHPLAGKTLGENKFWDLPIPPTDDIPPGNWANFSPAGWVQDQRVDVSLQVEDTYSGLDVHSAQYSYSTDCSGRSGSNAPQVISAAVPFGQDSGGGGLNQVRFRISDTAGNPGESPAFAVPVDSVLPFNPTKPSCPTHPESSWRAANQVHCTWSGAADASSGIAGYSVEWDHSLITIPAPVLETSTPEADSGPLADSAEWYLHVRAIEASSGRPSPGGHGVQQGVTLFVPFAPFANLAIPLSRISRSPFRASRVPDSPPVLN